MIGRMRRKTEEPRRGPKVEFSLDARAESKTREQINVYAAFAFFFIPSFLSVFSFVVPFALAHDPRCHDGFALDSL